MAMRIVLLVISSLGLVLTSSLFLPSEHPSTALAASSQLYRHSSIMEQVDRALDSIEDALSSVEEIQTAEDLEEAQDLAADAEQDIRDAIFILENIEIPNWLWLLEQGALYWHGPILDKETEQPVEANVFANGHLVANQAAEVQFLMWETEHNPIYVRVIAEGYNPWELRFRFHLQGLKVIEGPVWLVPEGGGTGTEGG